jgi:hypothetical protein
MNIDPINWAKLASLIDGEGCISGSNSTSGSNISITITNTSIVMMEWLKDNFGGEYYGNGRKKEDGTDRAFQWRPFACDRKVILENTLSHYIVKTKQALIGLEILKLVGYQGVRTINSTKAIKDRLIRAKLVDLLQQVNQQDRRSK